MSFANWTHVKTFEDLVRRNAAFVSGDLRHTPYSAGPLMPDSLPLVPNLLALHQFGLVTTCGQSKECKFGQLTVCGSHYYDSEQKPYISFTMLKTAAGTKLINELMNSNTFVVIVTDGATGGVDCNMPKFTKRYNVTRARSAESLESLADAAWDECTNLWSTPPHVLETDWPDHICDFLCPTAVSVDLAMKEYGKGDLESELVAICQAVGLHSEFDIGRSTTSDICP